MHRIITPDDVSVTIDSPTARINESENARSEIKSFVMTEWSDGDYESYIEEILDLFQSVDGTYGVVDVVTFIISKQYRESLVGVHKSLSMEDLFSFVGLENDDGVLEMGILTENMREDIVVHNSL